MSTALRVLIVEDSEIDAELILRELQRDGFEPAFERVDTAESMTTALEQGVWDLILSDYALPQFGGAAALSIFQEKALDVPFIIVSGALGEERAVEMMKAGAHDYVLKHNLARLAPAVKRELAAAQERRVGRQQAATVAYLASIVQSCDEAIVGKRLDGTIVSWNAGAEALYGYTAAEIVGRSVSLLVPANPTDALPGFYEKIKRGERVERFETVHVRKDGTPIEVSLTISPVKDAEGRIVGASTVALDISKRKQEEAARLRMIHELQEALTRVKTLSGLLPICAGCKKIRDDKGYWQQVETYIKEHSDADFTHGLCPDCFERLYPQYLHTGAEASSKRGE